MHTVTVEDDGFFTLSLGGVEKTLDLYDVFDSLRDITARCKDDTLGFTRGVIEYLAAAGFPAASQRAAVRFVDAVYARVEELRKKDSAAGGSVPPASPDSTGSGSETSRPASGSASSSRPTASGRKKS